MKKQLFLFIVLLGLFSKLNAQTDFWTNYTSPNLLGNLFCLKEDANGNKWMGTQAGLVKYDGNTWTIFNRHNSGLVNGGTTYQESVRTLEFDATNNLWIGTASSGVSKYDGTTWTNYTKSSTNNNLLSNVINFIFKDSNGKLWFATSDGISVFDGNDWNSYPRVTITGNNNSYTYPFLSITEDRSGNIWVAVQNDGIFKFNGTTWTSYKQSPNALLSNYIYSLAIDASNNLWIGTAAGLSKFNIINETWGNYTTTNTPSFSNNNIYIIQEDSNGNIWCGSYGNIYKFDGNSWSAYNKTNSEFVSSNIQFNKAILCNSGEIWFGSSNHGIYKTLDGSSWTHIINQNTIGGSGITRITQDNTGNIWASTSKGVSKFDGTNWKTYIVPDVNYNIATNSVFKDGTGNIWIGGFSGVSKLNKSNDNFENTGLTTSLVSDIQQDNLGNIWVTNGSPNGGVSKYDNLTSSWTSFGHSYTPEAPFPGLPVFPVAISFNNIRFDASGFIWGASMGNGFWKLVNNQWVDKSSALPGKTIDAMEIDTEGNLWLAIRYYGLYKFNPTTEALTRFNKLEEIYEGVNINSITITSITFEDTENLWISTQQQGIFRINLTTNIFKKYTQQSTAGGLIQESNSIIYIDANKKKWIGNANQGIISVLSDETTLPVQLTDFKGKKAINGNELLWTTLEEGKSKGYYIERKLEENDFKQIGFIPSRNLGTTTQQYSFTDRNPFSDGNYYRLKIEDTDGTTSYSKVIYLAGGLENKTTTLKVFPNPATNFITIETAGEKGKLIVFDSNGREVSSILTTEEILELDITHLTTGIYHYKLNNKRGSFIKL